MAAVAGKVNGRPGDGLFHQLNNPMIQEGWGHKPRLIPSDGELAELGAGVPGIVRGWIRGILALY